MNDFNLILFDETIQLFRTGDIEGVAQRHDLDVVMRQLRESRT